ncbi:MAG: sigma-54-dependent transcriptional regulator [Acidobacteriota bacterium]
MKHPNILVVDDDKNFLRVLTYQIQQFGFRPTPASSGAEALRHLAGEKFDLIVTDLKMPEMDGLELLRAVREQNAEIPVIVLTAYGSIDKAVDAIKQGAFDFLTKPFEQEEMGHAIANALKMAHLVEENQRLAKAVGEKFRFEGIVGSSKKFGEVLRQAQQLAEVDTTVLIQGESGTGKEIVARAVHFNSPRRKRPFVVVNCGAIPENLLESELFGYKKGSFTGATSDKKGKFEIADSGTVFLDEVGELPLSMQVKLLRVIQEKEIDVIGRPQRRSLDVRIVAASNKDLSQRVGEGAFREDLYYRLSVAPLYLPALRERREDIPLLVHHFLEKLNQRFGKSVRLEPAVVEALQRYRWPGNVRELENIVERLVVFDRQGLVHMSDLPSHLRSTPRLAGEVLFRLPEECFSLEELERDLLRAALERHDWNQTQAAHYLGISRNTLIYRMQKYNLTAPYQKVRPGPESS